MHITAIEQPRTLWQKLAYRFSERQFGKVLTPLKVIYARKPRFAVIAQLMAWTLEKGLSLEPSLRILVQVHVSRLNRCPFCEDLALSRAIRTRIGHERFRALADYRTSDLFSGRERAALRFTEEASRDRGVSDEAWALAHVHFTEDEIVELVWLNATENYFNLQAAVLGIGSDRLAER